MCVSCVCLPYLLLHNNCEQAANAEMTYCASPWQHSPVESMLHCLRMCFIPSYWLSDTTPVALCSLTMDELSDAVSISSPEDNVQQHKKAVDKK